LENKDETKQTNKQITLGNKSFGPLNGGATLPPIEITWKDRSFGPLHEKLMEGLDRLPSKSASLIAISRKDYTLLML